MSHAYHPQCGCAACGEIDRAREHEDEDEGITLDELIRAVRRREPEDGHE